MKIKMKHTLTTSALVVLSLWGINANAQSIEGSNIQRVEEFSEVNPKPIRNYYYQTSESSPNVLQEEHTGPNIHMLNNPDYDRDDFLTNDTLIHSDYFMNQLDVNEPFEITMFSYNLLTTENRPNYSLDGSTLKCTSQNGQQGYFFNTDPWFINVIETELYDKEENLLFPKSLKKEFLSDTVSCKFNLDNLNKAQTRIPLSQEDKDVFNNSLYFAKFAFINKEGMGKSEELKDNAFIGYEIKQKNKVILRQVTDVYYYPTSENDEEEIKSNPDDWWNGKKDEIDTIVESSKPKLNNNQDIKANILNGGITGGIISPDVSNGLSIEDVDFGTLKVGQVIPSQEKTNMISVRDWTGGNGWKLTAKHKNANRNESLQLGVQVIEREQVDLNNQEQIVTSGQAQLEPTIQSGEYTAKWGTHPTVGEFNNVIEWNLTANVTE